MSKTEAPTELLAEFDALFASEREPERVAFLVGGEKEAWVELTPMDSTASDRFATLGMKISHGAGGVTLVEGEIALDVRNAFIVSHTVTDFLLWRKERVKGRPDEKVWVQFGPPDSRRALPHFIEQQFKCQPKFWAWLVEQCQRVNAMDETTSGNSEEPSAS